MQTANVNERTNETEPEKKSGTEDEDELNKEKITHEAKEKQPKE